jgi:hypothetical protein
MQPENTRAPIGPEQQVAPATGGSERHIPVLPTPETGIETGAERVEQTAEARAAASDMAATGAPIMTMPAVPDPSAPASTSATSSPIVAADQDVIEKEWVDKAKKIISETKDDPHKRSAQVNDLQKDYLQKRYGKVLGSGA